MPTYEFGLYLFYFYYKPLFHNSIFKCTHSSAQQSTILLKTALKTIFFINTKKKMEVKSLLIFKSAGA